MSERAEPTTALGMAAAMKDASKGTDVIGESVKTFSMMGGGKNQKGDVLMSAASIVALGYVGWIVHSQLRELRHLASVSAGAAPPVSTTSPSNARPPPQVQFATTVIRD